MAALDEAGKSKRSYTPPQLKVHGTLTEITLMRFKWPDRSGLQQDPYVTNVS